MTQPPQKRAEPTPGPWRYQEASDAYTHIIRAGENRFVLQLQQDTTGKSEATARLIAAAVNAYRAAPDTAAERARLKAANTELVKALEEAAGFCRFCFGTGSASSGGSCKNCLNIRAVLANHGDQS